MSEPLRKPARKDTTPGTTLQLQRKCACGNHTLAGGQCEECRKSGGVLQRAPVGSPPGTATSSSPGVGQSFGKVPARGTSPQPALSTKAKIQQCEELLRGRTTPQEQESLLEILSTLPFSEIKNLVDKHGRRRFLRNFSGKRRREAYAMSLTAADLQDPKILAKLKSLRKPERYFKYLLDPAVRAHLEKLVRLRDISTPLDVQKVEPSGYLEQGVRLNFQGVEVTVKKDVKNVSRLWKEGETGVHVIPILPQGNRPASIQVTIETVYGEETDPEDKAGYGRGTTPEDISAGTTSLGFHEGQHGFDVLQYLQNNPPPQYSGQSWQQYEQVIKQYEQALTEYTVLQTDCPGIPISPQKLAKMNLSFKVCP